MESYSKTINPIHQVINISLMIESTHEPQTLARMLERFIETQLSKPENKAYFSGSTDAGFASVQECMPTIETFDEWQYMREEDLGGDDI